jgi:hypothetical protein
MDRLLSRRQFVQGVGAARCGLLRDGLALGSVAWLLFGVYVLALAVLLVNIGNVRMTRPASEPTIIEFRLTVPWKRLGATVGGGSRRAGYESRSLVATYAVAVR